MKKQDRLITYTMLIAGCLAVCHGWQVVDSGHRIEPILRTLLCTAYIPLAVIFKRRMFPFFFPALAYTILYFNQFQNYTSFFIILICCHLYQKYKWPYLALYAGGVIAALLINHRTASHAIIHLANCGWIYLVYLLILRKPRSLDLTADEKEILDEWTEVHDLKAITSASKNTLFKKLKEARERNHIDSNEALLERYQEEIGTKRDQKGKQEEPAAVDN